MTDDRIKELMKQVGHPHSHSIRAMIEQVANEVEQVARADERKKCADGWIPVSERMPVSNENVLLFTSGGDIMTGFYDPSDLKWCGNYWDVDVTHWQPLPAPPTGVK